MKGFIIAAPSSGSGKTTVTLGLLRLLRNSGVRICSGKAGPDFIDPQFHTLALAKECVNFDPWGMRENLLLDQAIKSTSQDELLLIEAMMGLFDGAADGTGSAADLAKLLNLPIILVIDCAKLSHSVAAIVHGFKSFRDDVEIAGVILNKVGSTRHEDMLRAAIKPLGIKVFGAVMRDSELALPERHLGLVQAFEHPLMDQFIENAARKLKDTVAVEDILDSLSDVQRKQSETVAKIPPLGQRIAVAKDLAFSFIYPHLIEGWKEQGAEISFFSPLSDEGPDDDCDAVFLPGGYPELHADAISQADNFRILMQKTAQRGVKIYGECGGYMTLGEGLVDADGVRHKMLGLLPVATSFSERKRNLGYRKLESKNDFLGIAQINAHEFHYSTEIKNTTKAPLFAAQDALGNDLGTFGAQVNNIAGSYMHIIDRAD
ncbi:MAG: cobyrinate a,c-diamide synthase [Lentilitoribacter sp.]